MTNCFLSYIWFLCSTSRTATDSHTDLWKSETREIKKSYEHHLNSNSCIDFQKKNDCRQFAFLKYKSYFKVSDIQLHRCQLELQFWIALSHDSYTFFIDYYAIFKSSSFQNHIVILLIRNVYALYLDAIIQAKMSWMCNLKNQSYTYLWKNGN